MGNKLPAFSGFLSAAQSFGATRAVPSECRNARVHTFGSTMQLDPQGGAQGIGTLGPHEFRKLRLELFAEDVE